MKPNFERLDRAFNRIIHPEPGDPGFYFGNYNSDVKDDRFILHKANSCGSFCCVLGLLPVCEPEWGWSKYGAPMLKEHLNRWDLPTDSAMEFFGLDEYHAAYLFYPVDVYEIDRELTEQYGRQSLRSNATPQQVYDNYIRFKEAYSKENLDKK
jgi:hypothetical protein